MSEPFLAEIKIVGWNFAARSWALCDGQILPINQNQSLYSLLGTTYGGDGRTSFALPDLRGRVPIHKDSGLTLGARGGSEQHTLSASEIPTHTHGMNATTGDADSGTGAGNLFARAEVETHTEAANDVSLSPSAIGNTGGNQGHNNMQPYLTLNFQIAIQGLFPSRN